MAEGKTKRLSKVAREFNIGIATIVDFLNKKGHKIESNPNTKIAPELYNLLVQEYSSEIDVKKESEKVNLRSSRDKKQEIVTINDLDDSEKSEEASSDEVLIKDTNINLREEAKSRFKEKANLKILGKIDIDSEKKKEKEEEKKKEEEEEIKEEIKEPDKKVKKEEKPKEEEEKQEKPETTEQEVSEVVDKEKGKEGEDFEEEQEVEEEFTTGEEEIIEEEDEPEIIESESLKELKKKSEEKGYEVKVVGKIDLDSMNQKTRPARKSKEEKEKERIARRNKQLESEKAETPKKDTDLDTDKTTSPVEGEKKEDQKGKAPTEKEKISGPTIIGKISLPGEEDAEKDEGGAKDKKKRRKRIKKDKERINIEDEKELKGGEKGKGKKQKKKTKGYRHEISEEDVEKQIKDTLARLTQKGKSSKGAKYRREKRDAISQKKQEEVEKKEQDKNVLKVTEFVSVSELANMMSVSPTEVIQTCMNLGLFVSINQRLDAETMALVADEFNYKVDFISVEVQEAIKVEEDEDEQLLPRPPIVTVMGHVDHGKTKLLDHIRKTNVIAGEAGGITQHIGAYNVSLHDGRQITFLDTPGHEAFTAMRARGAQVTDIAIIVVAADDGVKPQTVEAINHAHAAGVPIVFAINKIDKPTANPEKIKEELANMNFLVEDWGGKYQSQEISAKNGVNMDELMEKVLLEAELLELKANPEKRAYGTVVESSLDRGRGYTATVLVEAGTLTVGDVLLAGSYFGHVKAMYNEREKKIEKAGPSMPVLILGLNGAPQAGDKFNVMESDREAKEIANKREQLQREQGLRTQKHITLDEIGRRIAIGNFQELNIIVKGDFDGSVEALSDSLIKLSTEEIQVNIIHKAVGQISEMDIMLAVASNAIVVGFQVRPSLNARKLAEKEEIEIRLYSIIYDAIEEVKMAMEGMLTPEIKEEVVATVEVQEVFKISKVGTVAGCLVRDGKINRNSKVRVIRDGIVVYTGNLGSLKRFKDDVKEVSSGFECGLNIENYNDIKVGDMIEAFREVEVKKKL